jgi:23S rRNA (uracil1939-C5)-methyltransferase
MAHGGAALGRHEGRVLFVPYAIPGEEVAVEIVEDHKRWAHARLLEVITPSPDRVADPPCPHFGPDGCGGCHWQHITYPAQLAYKRAVVRDQLTRIGQIADPPVREVIPSSEPWAYRNQVQLHPTDDGRLGYVRADRAGVIPITTCPLMHPLLAEMFDSLDLDFAALNRLTLRAGTVTGQQMAILETEHDEPPEIAVDAPISVNFLLSDGTPVTLVGHPWIEEVVASRTWRVSAPSFFQVNTAAAEELVRIVHRYAAPRTDAVLLDLYAGVGLFGLTLAPLVGEAYLVEENPHAVADALTNAAGQGNVTLMEGAAEEALSEWPGLPIDVVVLDPPRGGCDQAVLDALARLSPERLVYVSCDPATLARDLRRLLEGGFHLVEVQPVDLFPQTYHVECVALLDRSASPAQPADW